MAAEFSNEMLKLWTTLREIVSTNAHRRWEDEGGRQREYYDADCRLKNELLGLGPHECSPIWAVRYGPPPASLFDDTSWAKLDCREQWSRESFTRAWKLGKALDAAVASKRQPTPVRQPAPS
jgi:hypothetical protein